MSDGNELATLKAIVSRVDDADTLLDQLDGATLTATPTEVVVTCREGVARSGVGDGPLPVRALVQTAAGATTGEVLVWMESGFISSAEHAWYTDDPPTTWPAAADLVFV